MRRRLRHRFEILNDAPDVVLIHACTVTALAEKKARQAARRARRAAPTARIVLIGCLADAVAMGLTHFDEADLLAGGLWRPRIEEVVEAALGNVRGLLPPPPDGSAIEASDGPANRIRAFLKVQDGCSMACTYCRPTQVRGPSRSKSILDAVAEARRMIENGFSELVLTGINLALYAPRDGRLHDLVEAVLELPDVRRLRLASINPSGLTRQLLALFKGESRLCPHFHVPLQSGDDAVLARMQRGYSASEYESAIETAREIVGEATFGADLIVGFPGETVDAFDRTVDLVERIGFVNLHVFRYSDRPGTQAAQMSRRVPEAEKRRRADVLHLAWESSRNGLLDKRIGTSQHVLAEEHRQGRWLGYTRDYIYVSFESTTNIAWGDETPVLVDAHHDGVLKGVEAHRNDAC